MPLRPKPEPQASDAPPLQSAENQADETRNNVPRQEHGGVTGKELLRPKLEIMRDEVYQRTGREKEWSVERIEWDVRQEPAIP